MDQLLNQIKRHEGYKQHSYRCSEGKLTIGYGYNLDANPLRLSSLEISHALKTGMMEHEADRLLNLMVGRCIDQLDTALPWCADIDAVRESVLINMAYNMGVVGLLKFTNTLSLIKSGDYAAAANEMLKSKWAKQVGHRAVELSEQMRTGVYGT
jgi:lysozyme